MELVRLDAGIAERDALVELSREHVVLFHCLDASTVLVVASLAAELTAPVGVWLDVSAGYPAQLAARDVATLAALVPLRHVVVGAASLVREQAEVLRALLTDDEVNFANEVADLRHAFNRPAPPRPVTVWSYEDGSLVSGSVVLVRGPVERRGAAELTLFT